jgi:hypothetical protein
MKSTSTPARRGSGSTYEVVLQHGLGLPGVEEGTSYGTPALKVRGKLLTRLWEDGETLVLRTTFVERDLLVQAEPTTYFFTEHYRNYPWVLVRLSRIPPAELRQRLEDAWRRVASQRLLAQFVEGNGGTVK